MQDDIPLDRIIIAKLIESEKKGRLVNARLLEADDGTSAVDVLRREQAEGRRVDFILMDCVMVRSLLKVVSVHSHPICFRICY